MKSNIMSNNNYDFLTDNNAFQAPEPEYRLNQQSEKLVFSTRLFPEWVTAAFAIFKKKYSDTPIDTSSKMLQLIIQDYIKQNYQLVGERLPATEEAIDLLIKGGLVNPDSKSQFRKLSKASQKATEYEAEALGSDSLKKKYEYWKSRDPEKAEEIMKKMQEDMAAMEQDEEDEQNKQQQFSSSTKEAVISENRSGYEQQEQQQQQPEDGIATLDYLDDLETKEED